MSETLSVSEHAQKPEVFDKYSRKGSSTCQKPPIKNHRFLSVLRNRFAISDTPEMGGMILA